MSDAKTGAAALKPSPRSIKYHAVYAGGEFNRRVLRLIAMLDKVREELLDLAELGGDAVARAWQDAGLPPGPDPGTAAGELLDDSYDVAAEAGGCAWAVGSYLDVLRGHAVRHPSSRRR